MYSLSHWVAFNLLVIFLLALDLGVMNRKDHVIKVKEALVWTAFWVSLSLVFNLGVYYWFGSRAATDYLTGFLLEKSLSVDNLFVIVMVFNYFKVKPKYQHRVLFWGILGALIMRGTLIVLGSTLVKQFNWILYIFGAFLVYTGIKMLFTDEDDEIEPENNPLVKLFKKFMPVTPAFHGNKLFIIQNGKRFATPLFITLIVVEVSDLIFAVDSIPAIFAVTQDPFIIYTSNVFAILGLRSLYFALAAIVDRFHYLQYGLSVILSFIGVKMLVNHWLHLPSWLTLVIVVGLLFLSVIASVIWPPKHEDTDKTEDSDSKVAMG